MASNPSYANLTRPQRPKALGLSPRFYVVVLIAAVLMIGLQAIPLLRGQGPTEAGAAATQQDAPAVAPDAPPGQGIAAQPAATIPEPQASAEATSSANVAANPPAAAEISVTLVTPTTSDPISASPASPPPESARAIKPPPTGDSVDSILFGASEENSSLWSKVDAADAIAETSQETPTTTVALASNAKSRSLEPATTSPPPAAQPQSKPTAWTGVLRLLSAVTRVDLTNPGRGTRSDPVGQSTSPSDPPVTDEASPVATPEDEDDTSTESTAQLTAQPDLSAGATRAAAAEPARGSAQSLLVIVNPLDSGGTIHYLVENEITSLRPGESQTLRPPRARIRFHRGGNFGDTEVVVTEGTYTFHPSRQGWMLTQ